MLFILLGIKLINKSRDPFLFIYRFLCNANRDYFMGRERVRDFRTSWWCIRNRTSELSERVRFLVQTTSVKIPYKRPAHEVIYLFHTYWVNISSLYLERMTGEFKKQGPAHTKCFKKYIIRWALQILWVKILTKIDQKRNTICRLETVYDDYIIKWPLRQ